MLKTITGAAPVHARTEPSSLLKLVAGEFAAPIATLWPEPHAEFLTASVARRHLACLALALSASDEVVREALSTRLRVAVSRIARPTPTGLERALARLGDTAWSGEAYRSLLELLADREVGKALRHAEAIDAAPVARLSLLPAPMRRAWRLSCQLTDDAARAVSECADVIAFRGGVAEAEAAARGWATAETQAALFEAVREDL
jgi:hypothetical protein